MTFPILEFDSTPEAFIEPSKIIRARDLPDHCVICFFREVIDKVIAEYDAKVMVENRWEDGPHQIYEISYHNQRLAFFHPGVGAPMAATCTSTLTVHWYGRGLMHRLPQVVQV